MSVIDEKQLFIGKSFLTHYGTKGVIKRVLGPYEDNTYSIIYKCKRNGKCFINGLIYKNGKFYKEGKPLIIMKQAEDHQLTLFY